MGGQVLIAAIQWEILQNQKNQQKVNTEQFRGENYRATIGNENTVKWKRTQVNPLLSTKDAVSYYVGKLLNHRGEAATTVMLYIRQTFFVAAAAAYIWSKSEVHCLIKGHVNMWRAALIDDGLTLCTDLHTWPLFQHGLRRKMNVVPLKMDQIEEVNNM